MKYNYISRLEKIEEEIKRAIPFYPETSWIMKNAGNCNALDPETVKKIHDPCHELLFRGGKRWRPLVLMLTSEAFSTETEMALKLTPVVELAHNGSLLIDDIEDQSEERRGKPAVHLLYGEDMTINSGNYLYFLPTAILDSLKTSDSMKLSLYNSYNSNMRRLHFGQGMDIQWHRDHSCIPRVEEYLQMCRFKTGSLAGMAGQMGAITSHYSDSESIRQIWENIGVGFQILDDVKNLTTGNPGKLRGDDIIEGKKSLPVILYSNSNNSSELLSYIKKAVETGNNGGYEYVEKAISVLTESGAIDEAGNIGKKLLENNMESLHKIYDESEAKKMLIGIAESFIEKML